MIGTNKRDNSHLNNGGDTNPQDTKQPRPGSNTPIGSTLVTCQVAASLAVVITRQGTQAGVENVRIRLSGPSARSGATDSSGIQGFQGLTPGAYTLELSLDGTTWSAPRAIQLAPGYRMLRLALPAAALARPTLELQLMDGTPVAGVRVRLGPNHDLGETDVNGRASHPGLVTGSYDVTLTFKARDVDKYRIVTTQPIQVVAGQSTNHLRQLELVGVLVLELHRHDGQPLRDPVVFNLTPASTGTTVQHTTAAVTLDGVPKQRKELKTLAPGDYTVQLSDVTAVLNAQKTQPLDAWRLGPSKSGEAQVKVVAGETTVVRFTLTRYNKVQFIAFNIKPGTDSASGSKKDQYLGSTDDFEDVGMRCLIMKEAMKAAYHHADVKTDPNVLKVFMGPEFYFRGANGAYELASASEIMAVLREEAEKPDYEDWLFVYGTAIGQLKHQKSRKNAGASRRYHLRITQVTANKLTVTQDPSLTGKQVCRVDICANIPSGSDTSKRWKLEQGTKTAGIQRSTRLSDTEYELELDNTEVFALGAFELHEPIATEVFNLALVQKGGPSAGKGGLREAIVYKEYVSHIDFMGPNSTAYNDFHDASGKGRLINIHGEAARGVLPTQGSRDVLGANPNNPSSTGSGSELMKTGLGGGSVFTIDGIGFGLEVCRDHGQNRLHDYYKTSATSGTPKPQVHLIPSWGMSIEGGPIHTVPNGLVFNVDGPNGSTAGVLTRREYECDVHRGTTYADPGVCPQQTLYFCNAHDQVETTAGNCVCGQPLQQTDYYWCDTAEHTFFAPGHCSLCGLPLVEVYACMDFGCANFMVTHGSPGTCTGCPATLSPVYSCSWGPHQMSAATECSECLAPLRTVTTYECHEHQHARNGPGPCGHCAKPLIPFHHYHCDQHTQRSSSAGNCACGQPFQPVSEYWCDTPEHLYTGPGFCTLCASPLEVKYECLDISCLGHGLQVDSPDVCFFCSVPLSFIRAACPHGPHQVASAAPCICGNTPRTHILFYTCDSHQHMQSVPGPCTACGVRTSPWNHSMSQEYRRLTPSTTQPAVPDSTGPVKINQTTRTLTAEQAELFERTGKIEVYPEQDVPEAEVV